MPRHRAYVFDPVGHITERVDLSFRDKADAEKRAWSLARSRNIELWQEDRHLKTFRYRARTRSIPEERFVGLSA
jgi:hypothetical protein